MKKIRSLSLGYFVFSISLSLPFLASTAYSEDRPTPQRWMNEISQTDYFRLLSESFDCSAYDNPLGMNYQSCAAFIQQNAVINSDQQTIQSTSTFINFYQHQDKRDVAKWSLGNLMRYMDNVCSVRFGSNHSFNNGLDVYQSLRQEKPKLISTIQTCSNLIGPFNNFARFTVTNSIQNDLKAYEQLFPKLDGFSNVLSQNKTYQENASSVPNPFDKRIIEFDRKMDNWEKGGEEKLRQRRTTREETIANQNKNTDRQTNNSNTKKQTFGKNEPLALACESAGRDEIFIRHGPKKSDISAGSFDFIWTPRHEVDWRYAEGMSILVSSDESSYRYNAVSMWSKKAFPFVLDMMDLNRQSGRLRLRSDKSINNSGSFFYDCRRIKEAEFAKLLNKAKQNFSLENQRKEEKEKSRIEELKRNQKF